jgi:hypothetical protein
MVRYALTLRQVLLVLVISASIGISGFERQRHRPEAAYRDLTVRVEDKPRGCLSFAPLSAIGPATNNSVTRTGD